MKCVHSLKDALESSTICRVFHSFCRIWCNLKGTYPGYDAMGGYRAASTYSSKENAEVLLSLKLLMVLMRRVTSTVEGMGAMKVSGPLRRTQEWLPWAAYSSPEKGHLHRRRNGGHETLRAWGVSWRTQNQQHHIIWCYASAKQTRWHGKCSLYT